MDPKSVLAQFLPIIREVRLAHGLVGKSTMGLIAFIALLAVVLFRSPTSMSDVVLLSIVAFGFVSFVLFLFVNAWFASKNPGAALLEGAHLVSYRRLELGAKHPEIVTVSATIADPSTSTELQVGDVDQPDEE